jgi:hypothetical protein
MHVNFEGPKKTLHLDSKGIILQLDHEKFLVLLPTFLILKCTVIMDEAMHVQSNFDKRDSLKREKSL